MASERPHIVLIMTDQQRFDTIRAWGYEHMVTPHQNRLVREQAYCPGATISLYAGRLKTMPSCMVKMQSPSKWIGYSLDILPSSTTMQRWTKAEDARDSFYLPPDAVKD